MNDWVAEMSTCSPENRTEKQDDRANDEKHAPVFDPDWYVVNRYEIAIIMGFFFMRYLNLLYRKFEGDFVSCMVLGEIANHNVSGFFTEQGSCIEVLKQLKTRPERIKLLKPTNAFSISEVTGIPRETVRRKIDKLQKKGWIVKSEQGELFISETVGDHFTTEFNKKILAELFEANDCLRKLKKSQ